MIVVAVTNPDCGCTGGLPVAHRGSWDRRTHTQGFLENFVERVALTLWGLWGSTHNTQPADANALRISVHRMA